ncbi:MAG: dTDP-4-dehydrorhamnose reductase [Acidobacteria bacterium]|nr:dTDP-4-dehydrorhamnose reductase [Acidobacteriota bacterium]
MKVLVTGAAGQLGHELSRVFSGAGHEVVATSHATLDIADPAAVVSAVDSARPDWILHGAAWTAVDACESDPAKAEAVNGGGSRNVVAAAERVGARVLYVSTDYVFDGTKSTPYVETDRTNPQSVYGASKLSGEHAMRDSDLVTRISWVCGYHGNNMVKTILRIASAQPGLKFVDDQIGHPTFADDAAAGMLMLVEAGAAGTFHLTNQGAVSWCGFARAVLEAAGEDPARVEPIATADLQPPRPAKRPANSVLDNATLRGQGFALLDDFRLPLGRLVRRLLAD